MSESRAAQSVTQVESYLPLVRTIARRMQRQLPAHVELDDLVQAGTLGLLDAASRFDGGKDVQFKTYAHFRIRGAILDSLRELDPGSRELRQRARSIEQAHARLSARLHRTPEEEEIAAELRMTVAAYQECRRQLHELLPAESTECERDGEPASLLDGIASDMETPGEALMKSETRALVARAIAELPVREQQVLSLYYFEELNMKEVGEVMGVVESRVSQLRTAAIARLRTILLPMLERPMVAHA